MKNKDLKMGNNMGPLNEALLLVNMTVGFAVTKMNMWMDWWAEGRASCLVWSKQAESYSPVWPRGTPCSKPSPANACTLSWSMDDMLVALMAARAGRDGQRQTLVWLHTQTNKRHGRAVAHFTRVTMRSSVSQPSLLHGSCLLDRTKGWSGIMDNKKTPPKTQDN